eukprot:CAMPEP_0184691996 /NCGR_PEP_ID=MMETSP0313-20130426/654_1 /TAXON_ID=2792 /ORGANISM="Porphyridium aerugineum, Strain SAG 1380-2" /LENGTH=598 /DNA_ID=CAMNT_0027149789 /DNA_START=87 /DNA_END=1883 /DNA_ORIENTATION=-
MDSKAPPPGSTVIQVVIDDSLWKGMEAFHINAASSAPSQPLRVVVMPMTKMQDVRDEVVTRLKEVVTPNQLQAIVQNSEQGGQGESSGLDSAKFVLMCKDKVVDLILPFRLTNLPQPVKLRLVSQRAVSYVASMANASHKKFKTSATPASSSSAVPASANVNTNTNTNTNTNANANTNTNANIATTLPTAKPSVQAPSNLVSVAVYLVEADGSSKRIVARVDPQTFTIKALAEKAGFNTTLSQLSACVVKVDEKLVDSTNYEASLAELGHRTGSVQIKIYLVAELQAAPLAVPPGGDDMLEISATVVAAPMNTQSASLASIPSTPAEQPKETSSPAESNSVADKLISSHAFHASRVRIVLPPSGNTSGTPGYEDEDDSFYELRQGELLAIMKQTKDGKENGVLMTSAMRAKKEQSSRPKYESIKIRIRFQDRFCIQAEFPVNATIGNLYDLVASCLSDEGKASIKSYYLYVSPPVTKFLDRNQTLEKAHLVPSAIVLLGVEPHMLVSERPEFSSTWALRKELLDEAFRDEEVRKAHWEQQQANVKAEREAEEAARQMQIDSAPAVAADASASRHDASVESKLADKIPQKVAPKWFKKQ